MKEVVISTSGLNSYGSRVLTEGIDTVQYEKNPVLLWMHRRGTSGCDAMPIGRIENLRKDGDRLIGTPVFDEADEFARKVRDKWENGFLRMASAGLEVTGTSSAPEHLVEGQTLATVTDSKLVEVSIVDIGANDEAIQLLHGGKVLELASGSSNGILPVLGQYSNNNQTSKKMEKKDICMYLGLDETASDEQVIASLKLMKERDTQMASLELSMIESTVDAAISEKRVDATKRNHFIELGKKVGVKDLKATLELMVPPVKPLDVIRQENGLKTQDGELDLAKLTKLSEVPTDKVGELKEQNPAEYMRLYKGEYGVEF